MKFQKIHCARIAALGLGAIALFSVPALVQNSDAVVFQDGSIAFETPPRVRAASANRNLVMSDATYYFTFDLPAAAGEPLKAIVIEPRDFLNQQYPYRLEGTRAFVGDRFQRGEALPLAQVTQNPDNQSITVEFEPPVEPGQMFTVALEPVRAPRRAGTYTFQCTALPAGDLPRPAFAGVTSLTFYERDGNDIFID